MQVTVLMPAYNAEKYITNAIYSVLSQTFTDFELLIVNDGSSDNTENLVRSFHDPRIVLINQNHAGIASALNTGLQKASAELIARFDADDICYPERLEKQYDFINKNHKYIIVGSAADYVDENGSYIFTCNPPAVSNNQIQILKKIACPFIHSSVLFKKGIVIQNGGYNTHAHSFEDHFLWASILDKGKAYNIPDPLLKVRLNPHSITINERCRTKQFRRIKSKALLQSSISEREGHELKKIIEGQNKRKIKKTAYYSLLAKKFLWNNYQPAKARQHLWKAIRFQPFQLTGYGLLILSCLSKQIINSLYRTYKPAIKSAI